MHENLLKPSLSDSTPPARLYSTRSSFIVAFMGGPVAIVLYSALNSWRLRRPADLAAYIATLILQVMLLVDLRDGGAVVTWFTGVFGDGSARYLLRLLALAAFGAFYLMHKKQHRSAELFDTKPPSPWVPAIICMVAGYGITRGLFALLTTVQA